jgi:hypothetical protein
MNATNRRFGIIAAGLLGLLAAPAVAGPPLICFPAYHGNAPSLPWQNGGPAKSQDRSKLVADTMKLLQKESSALARMETIRRATLYVNEDKPLAEALFGAVAGAALDAEANLKGPAEARADAWFNAGYLAACYGQMGIGEPRGKLDGHPGLAWLRRAIDLSPENAEMNFGAALAALDGDGTHKPYLKRAVAGATPGSDLARSIESHAAFGGKKLAEQRKDLGLADATPSGR